MFWKQLGLSLSYFVANECTYDLQWRIRSQSWQWYLVLFLWKPLSQPFPSSIVRCTWSNLQGTTEELLQCCLLTSRRPCKLRNLFVDDQRILSLKKDLWICGSHSPSIQEEYGFGFSRLISFGAKLPNSRVALRQLFQQWTKLVGNVMKLATNTPAWSYMAVTGALSLDQWGLNTLRRSDPDRSLCTYRCDHKFP